MIFVKQLVVVLVIGSTLSVSGNASRAIVKLASLSQVQVATDSMLAALGGILRGELAPDDSDYSATVTAVQDYFATALVQTTVAEQSLELLEDYSRWAIATEQHIDSLLTRVAELDTDTPQAELITEQLDRIKLALADRGDTTRRVQTDRYRFGYEGVYIQSYTPTQHSHVYSSLTREIFAPLD